MSDVEVRETINKNYDIKSRINKKSINNFGSEIIIIKYINYDDVDVFFPEYNWTKTHAKYDHFKKGTIKCPYEPRVYGVGYIGEGKYKARTNGKKSRCYKIWSGMIQRCYSEKFQYKHQSYRGCVVCDEWLNFQKFAKWYYENYYENSNDVIELDKDILIKDNKLYSPETCLFVPKRINSLFAKRKANRGKYPIGVCFNKVQDKFEAYCSDANNKRVSLGYFNTSYNAFNVYKKYKENLIKNIADKYKSNIPISLYNAMYNYKVEITD